MPNSGAAAFWSYTHDDDALSGGAIVGLAQRLKAEYELVTGEELELFVDRESVEWGQEWNARIEAALVETTFFIPIVSPRYFVSDECRKELETFASQAQSLGVTEFVLPVLYVEVPDLKRENTDPLVALVAGTQYEKWTALRLEDPESSAVRKAVSRLASRLKRAGDEIASRQISDELDEGATENEEPGLAELVAEIGGLLPDWLDAVETDPLLAAQFQGTNQALLEKRRKLRAGGRAVAKQRSALLIREAAEFLPIEERRGALAKTYLRRTVELNSLVTTAIRIVERHPESRSLLRDLEEGVSEAMENIERENIFRENMPSLRQWASANAHVSRLMKQLADVSSRADSDVKEGNSIVLEWATHLGSGKGEGGVLPRPTAGAPRERP